MIEADRPSATSSDGHDHYLSYSHPQNRAVTSAPDLRIMELEIENTRLQRLVAELLLKNQQLRKECEQENS